MLFRVLRALNNYPWRPAAVTATAFLLSLLTRLTDALHQVTTGLVVFAVGGFAVLTGWWWARTLAPALTTKGWVARRDEHAERAGGVASWLDVGEHASTHATRTRAIHLRPSLATAGWWRRWRTPVTAYAVPLLSTGWLPWCSRVWSTCEDVTLRIGGPRSGKSGSLACHGLDAPGALLVTTSRTDLLQHTRTARERVGRVDVFNPTGLGSLASTVRWSPLAGCQDLGTAYRRAADLIPTGSSSDGERWDTQARGMLAVLLHAAALSGGTLRTVMEWVSPPDVIGRDQILTALKASPDCRSLSAEVRALYSTNDRTLTSITATLIPAVRWVADTTAAHVGDAPLDHPDFLDVQAFVEGGADSLYLIGREGNVRTLIGALTAEVAHQVRMVAATTESGRLDPPMTALLDEAPLTCGPIPLHDWTSDMGGRGLTLHIAAQSLAQMRDVWGHDRAAAILGNTAALLVFGGLKTSEDLERISTLCGNRLFQLDPDDRRPIPVMTPAEISSLPPTTALLLRTALRPLVGRAPMVWDRHPGITSRTTGRLAGLAVRAGRWMWDAIGRLPKPTRAPRPATADRTADSGTAASSTPEVY